MYIFARTDDSILSKWWWTIDRWILLTVTIIIGIGFLLILAASPAVASRLKLDSFYFIKRHFIFLIPTFFIILGVSLLSVQNILRLSLIVFFIGIILLIMTFVMGVEIKGSKRWLSFFGFSLQPSEFVKPAFVIMCAWFLSLSKKNINFPSYKFIIGFYFLFASFLLLQPDLGMFILVSIVCVGQVFFAGMSFIWMIVGSVIGIIGTIIAYFCFPHFAKRIDNFFEYSNTNRYAEGFQVNQSMEAFTNGGFFGQGPGEGILKRYLPDAHADFIFAVAGEEFGFLLCFVIILLFSFIILRTIIKILNENNFFIIFSVAGLIMEFGLQAMINISSTINLIPTKGMTLPFISYGGSSILAMALTIGMILGLTRRRVNNGEVF